MKKETMEFQLTRKYHKERMDGLQEKREIE